MDRLKRSARWNFETEDGRMQDVRIRFRFEGQPAIIVGDWQCPADTAEEARKWVPQWAAMATQVFLEAKQEGNGNIEGLPDSLRYFERLRVEDEEYTLASVNLEWEADPREYVQRRWRVSTYTREWVDIQKKPDGHPRTIVTVSGEGN